MKKKKTFSVSPTKKRKKTKWFDVFITAFVILTIGGFLVGVMIFNYQQDSKKYEMYENLKFPPAPGEGINPKMVCMVKDMYMGIDQVPVSVQDRTYYACCDQCVRDLNNSETVRYAIDPYSKVSVDKANAFITMNPKKKGTILYFESEENAKKYLQK